MTDTPVHLPPVIFGTSCLGNLYEATSFDNKLAIVKACIEAAGDVAVFDTAGKYGAGLALQTLGKCLEVLNIPAGKVIISNKLGWYQTPLQTPEPTFEPGVWKDLKHDAVQKISYQGILDCFEQGNSLLGSYNTQMVSVHDPDDYLAGAADANEEAERFNDILEAYRALHQLKQRGQVTSIGIGAKNWRVIQRIALSVQLDWVMVANSLTLKEHPAELIAFIKTLADKNITVINSAVFNGGFLIGGDFYNYAPVNTGTPEGAALYYWRNQFFNLCQQFNIKPAEACFAFGFNIPGVKSIALNTTKPHKVPENVAMATKTIPAAFWQAMTEHGLLESLHLFN